MSREKQTHIQAAHEIYCICNIPHQGYVSSVQCWEEDPL